MSWAAVGEAAKYVLPTVSVLALWYLRDRRKDRAAAEVAEKTVEADVEVKEIGAQDARLVHLTRVWETQREGLEAALEQRDQLITWQRGELDRRDALISHRDQIITGLRRQLEAAEGQLADVSRQLVACRHQLDELTEEETTP